MGDEMTDPQITVNGMPRALDGVPTHVTALALRAALLGTGQAQPAQEVEHVGAGRHAGQRARPPVDGDLWLGHVPPLGAWFRESRAVGLPCGTTTCRPPLYVTAVTSAVRSQGAVGDAG